MTETRKSAPEQNTFRLIALTGFMGAGKSTVGRALAVALGWTFVDLDSEIERSRQLRIRDLFRDLGEAHFREIETAVLTDMLQTISTDTVLALGGGTFIEPRNVALLTQHKVQLIFLDAPVEELFRRCATILTGEENLRPLTADLDAFVALYQRRLPHYRKAHLTVTTSGKAADVIAQQIIDLL